MKSDRFARINEILKREIGTAILQTDLGGEIVTVTHVSVSRNLRRALVFVSTMHSGEARDRALHALNQKRNDIQQRIAKRVILKYTPCISFRFDPSLESGDKVLGILSGLDTEGDDSGEVVPGDGPGNA